MVQATRIINAILRCGDWLASEQTPSGKWTVNEDIKKVPVNYQKDLILTSQCLQALIYAQSKKYLSNITKALNYCLMYQCSSHEDIDSWAWKLSALRFLDTKLSRKLQKELTAYLRSEQRSDGGWPFSISTYTVTNFSVVFAIKNRDAEKELHKAKEWFLASKSNKGTWKEIPEATEPGPGFTGTSIVSLLMIGEDPTSDYFSKSLEFIRQQQKENGGWMAPRTPKGKCSIWATAMCLEALMRSSENPFSDVVERGINYLLNSQTKEGYFPRSKGGKAYHTSFYAIRVLALYMYLRKTLASRAAERLGQYLDNKKQLINYYAEKFEEDVSNVFKMNSLRSVIESRAIGATKRAVQRRIDILHVLWEYGENEIAEVINFLKENPKYSHLNKKSHITQIKADMNYLRGVGLVQEHNNRYYAAIKV